MICIRVVQPLQTPEAQGKYENLYYVYCPEYLNSVAEIIKVGTMVLALHYKVRQRNVAK